MKLITETINDGINYLVEEKNGKKSQYIEGVFLQAELKNRNNRVYPVNILEREVNKYIEEHVNRDRAVGELGHPDGPTINLDRVSHRIVSLRKEGNNFIGKARILGTPMGKIAKQLLDEGVRLGVSSRGLGTVERREGTSFVRDDFMLATAADIVADPSAPDAFVDGIMEGKEWVWSNGVVKEEKVAKYHKFISESELRELESRKLKVFQDFLGTL
tara:strand:+ start:1859 stop:2506 length:648 start_codon:yes stop_codon:yes gene_type:complete